MIWSSVNNKLMARSDQHCVQLTSEQQYSPHVTDFMYIETKTDVK